MERLRLEGGRGFIFASLTGRGRGKCGFWLISDRARLLPIVCGKGLLYISCSFIATGDWIYEMSIWISCFG